MLGRAYADRGIGRSRFKGLRHIRANREAVFSARVGAVETDYDWGPLAVRGVQPRRQGAQEQRNGRGRGDVRISHGAQRGQESGVIQRPIESLWAPIR